MSPEEGDVRSKKTNDEDNHTGRTKKKSHSPRPRRTDRKLRTQKATNNVCLNSVSEVFVCCPVIRCPPGVRSAPGWVAHLYQLRWGIEAPNVARSSWGSMGNLPTSRGLNLACVGLLEQANQKNNATSLGRGGDEGTKFKKIASKTKVRKISHTGRNKTKTFPTKYFPLNGW